MGAARVTLAAFIAVAAAQSALGGQRLDSAPHNLNGVCDEEGKWLEAPHEDVMAGKKPPLAQCWRKPVCLHSEFADPNRCQHLREPEDWPTWDPYLTDEPHLHTFPKLVETFFRGKSVIFTGDSVNIQVFQAAICEAAREYDLTHVTHYLSGPPEDDPKWAKKFATFFFELHTLTQQDLTEPGSVWKGGPVMGTEIIAKTKTFLSRKGWHRFSRTDMEAQMQLADILIVNYGHHYAAAPEQYEKDLEELFPMLDYFSSLPGKVAVFRETSADHLPYHADKAPRDEAERQALEALAAGEAGRVDAEAEALLPETARGCRCAPTDARRNETAKYRLINGILHRVAERFPRVGLLRWEDLTAERHDMHEGSYCAFTALGAERKPASAMRCCECVHFCYTPVFWKHVFSRLFDELERLGFDPDAAEDPGRAASSMRAPGSAPAGGGGGGGDAEAEGGEKGGEGGGGGGGGVGEELERLAVRHLRRSERREALRQQLLAGGAVLDIGR